MTLKHETAQHCPQLNRNPASLVRKWHYIKHHHQQPQFLTGHPKSNLYQNWNAGLLPSDAMYARLQLGLAIKRIKHASENYSKKVCWAPHAKNLWSMRWYGCLRSSNSIGDVKPTEHIKNVNLHIT